MDWERHKITAETTAIRGRGWLNLLGRLCGIGIVVIGAVNMMFPGVDVIFPVYRELIYSFTGLPGFYADFVAMVVGAGVAHFL